jgi:hypothetical protein
VAVFKYKTTDGYKTLEIPTVQRAVMPNADSMPVGAVVQYTGATTGDFVNGYFYKVIETSTTEQVTYIGYRMGSLYFSKKQGQTDGYFYSVPSSSATPSIRYLPKWTPLDGTHWVDSSGNVYNSFEEAPEKAQCSIMPYVSDPTTSTTWTFRMKQGSSYSETIQSNLDATTNAQGDGTREETVVTKSWQQINVQPSSAGEAESYNDLTDKPAINGHTLGGDQTSAQLGLMTPADIHVYSTTERLVGEWIDGSPVYERVFQLTNFTALNANTTYEFVKPVASYGIERLIDAMLIGDTFAVQDGKTPVYAIQHGISWYNKYDDVIKYTMQGAMGGSSTPLQHAYFIIRYTKVQS